MNIDLTDLSFEAIALLVTVGIGFAGYFVTHAMSIQRHKAEARLKFVSDQLEHLYGPLYSLVESNTAAWDAFRKTFRPGKRAFDQNDPLTDDECSLWAAWAEHVFIPSNLRIRDVIEANAHLLIDGEMPDCFRRVIAHIESSKIVLPAIREGDLSILEGFDEWPKDFNGFVDECYRAVAQEHSRQLGNARGHAFARRLRKRMEKSAANV